MSYDLFLKSETTPIGSVEFASYFEQRGNYTLNDGQAFYENEDTGVYFFFDQSDSDHSLAFNLNYFRPHFFGLEASQELASFIEQFDLAVHDPQTDGMGDGPFTIEGFLRSWNAGNRFSYQAILSATIVQKYMFTQQRSWNESGNGITNASLGKPKSGRHYSCRCTCF